MKMLLKLGVACALLAAAVVTLNAAGKGDTYADFKKKFESTVSKNRNAAADGLPSTAEDAFPMYARVMEDPYWQVRWPVMDKILAFETADLKAAFAKFMMDDKALKAALADKTKFEKVRAQLVWTYGHNRAMSKPEDFKPLADILLDEKQAMVVRTAAAKCLYNWPTARPTVAKPGATEEGRKEIEAKNKQINEIAQPIIKAKFRALFELLKRMKSDKKLADRVGEKSKDNEARLLKWLTVYGMERITSEERRDNVDAWDIFWTKVEKDGTDLTYRFDDDRSSTDVGGGENVNSRTTERKDKKKSTSTHLMVMPDFGFPDNYFEPYIYDFTEYFKLSTFVMPSGSKIGRPYVPDPRDKTPPTQGAYYFPTEKIGKLFVDQRKKEGGTIGMICHGMAANIAMEYAKADPEGCAFIVCAGANTGFKTETAARQNAENKGELAVKWFFKLSKFPKPEHTEEQGFDEVTGGISYLFADPLNYDQLVVWSTRNQWARNGGMDTDGKQTLIDDKYEFSAPQPVNVPALFIWGEADPVVSQDAISSIKKSFPNAVFVEKMKGVSRLPWLEDPIGFQDTFLKFMDDKKVWKRIEKAKETADKAAEKEATKGDKKAS